VLELLKANNIAPLFVPAGCTDLFRECDTVLNKPFKSGMKAGFRDYLHDEFTKYLLQNPTTSNMWVAKLTMGELKPNMISFVNKGFEAISTPAMKATIARAFQEDGLFALMLSPERVELAAATLASELSAAEDDEERRKEAEEFRKILEDLQIGEEVDSEDADDDDIAQGQSEALLDDDDDDDNAHDDGNDDDDAIVTEIVTPPVTAVAPVTVAPVTVVPVTVVPVTVEITHVHLTRGIVLKMKVPQLKSTLSTRGLNTNGGKTELTLRILDAFDL
jgi:hypothetical protein